MCKLQIVNRTSARWASVRLVQTVCWRPTWRHTRGTGISPAANVPRLSLRTVHCRNICWQHTPVDTNARCVPSHSRLCSLLRGTLKSSTGRLAAKVTFLAPHTCCLRISVFSAKYLVWVTLATIYQAGYKPGKPRKCRELSESGKPWELLLGNSVQLQGKNCNEVVSPGAGFGVQRCSKIRFCQGFACWVSLQWSPGYHFKITFLAVTCEKVSLWVRKSLDNSWTFVCFCFVATWHIVFISHLFTASQPFA